MNFCLILLAAGNSRRFGSKIPKPYIKVGAKTLIEHSLKKFDKVKQIKNIILVVNRKHSKYFKKIKLLFIKVINVNRPNKTDIADMVKNHLKFLIVFNILIS